MRAAEAAKTLRDGVLSLFFPHACACCGRYIKDFSYLYVCPSCYFSSASLPGPLCEKCSKPIAFAETGICRECREHKKHFSYAAASAVYEGAVRELIHCLKFYNKRGAARVLARRMAGNININVKDFDVILPVPAAQKRREERGYSHTRILARELSRLWGIKVCEGVKKIRETPPQNSLDRKERLVNLKGAFKAEKRFDNKKVLVLDDVYTTGATMNEMSKALLKAGADKVAGVAAARSI